MDLKKAMKEELRSRMKIFIKNPSASNFILLQTSMLAYQDLVKNQRG